MPDSSGVPVFAELAAMRDAIARRGGEAKSLNPKIPVDLIIDHSVAVDFAGTRDAEARNLDLEYSRNQERYAFLRWVDTSFDNVRIMPPGSGIVHQVNVEYLAQPAWTEDRDGVTMVFPDSLVGSDSHTPMVNALGVVAWGVGGIEAVSAALGEPIAMVVPAVVGCRLTGRAPAGTTASDLVLHITARLREANVVGKFVEFFGDGAAALPLPDRATVANMAPEYGATMGFFPVDEETLRYLARTGRSPQQVELLEHYAKAQGLWGLNEPGRIYSQVVEIDLAALRPSVAGPRRPNELRSLPEVPDSFRAAYPAADGSVPSLAALHDADRPLRDGDVVIASITSCTTTSNPALLIAAGLLARNARRRGLTAKAWIKRSFSPGSRVVADILTRAGLLENLEALGFYIVGYGCMACGGGTGPLAAPVREAIEQGGLTVAAVQSSNRNFEGRIHPLVKPSYLASPALTVAYALAGNVLIDVGGEPLGYDGDGAPVYLEDIWPDPRELAELEAHSVDADTYRRRYADMFAGDERWRALGDHSGSSRFAWNPASSFLRPPPYVETPAPRIADIVSARALLVLGDSVTTDHISPAGAIAQTSVAAEYLRDLGTPSDDIGTYVARRVNADVMVRGTFANTRIENLMIDAPGPRTLHMPDGEAGSIFEVAARYQADGIATIVVAGRDYGVGSSRDWAAKGTALLGVRAVLAESFERIHRSNLVGMGVLPLEFVGGETRRTLGIDGTERFDIVGLRDDLGTRAPLTGRITRADGSTREFGLMCRIDTEREWAWFRAGGVLPFVLSQVGTDAAQ